ncbi:unnamed protein product [Cunninghamella blakesleeana]
MLRSILKGAIVSNFESYFNTVRRNKPQKDTLGRAYISTLNTIKNYSSTPENIKNYIGVLINKLKDPDYQKAADQHYNFNSGQTSFGNNNKLIYNNTLPKDQKRKNRDNIDDFFNPISSSSSSNKMPLPIPSSSCTTNEEAFSTNSSINVKLPNENDRLIIDGKDVSMAFYNFQQFTINRLQKKKLYWESDIHHILSLSSIFLITPERMHKDVRMVVGDGTLNSLTDHFDSIFNMNECEFSIELTNKIMKIVKMVDRKKLDRDDAVVQLLLLKSESTPLEFKIIKSIKAMIETLPNEVLNDEPHEFELLSRYLNACLLPLFDSPNDGILFRWHDNTNLESSTTTASISKRRPDSSIVMLDGYCFDYSRGFGEVKSKHFYNKYQSINKDLARVGIFCKNSIDVNNMKGVLGFQAVGRNITFYISKLVSDGVYIMYQLKNFTVPGSVKQICSLLGYLDDLYFILNVFEAHCTQMEPEVIDVYKNKKRNSLSTPETHRITESSTNNKRPCITKHSI